MLILLVLWTSGVCFHCTTLTYMSCTHPSPGLKAMPCPAPAPFCRPPSGLVCSGCRPRATAVPPPSSRTLHCLCPCPCLSCCCLQAPFWACLLGVLAGALHLPPLQEAAPALDAVTRALANANRPLLLLAAGMVLRFELPQPRMVRCWVGRGGGLCWAAAAAAAACRWDGPTL